MMKSTGHSRGGRKLSPTGEDPPAVKDDTSDGLGGPSASEVQGSTRGSIPVVTPDRIKKDRSLEAKGDCDLSKHGARKILNYGPPVASPGKPGTSALEDDVHSDGRHRSRGEQKKMLNHGSDPGGVASVPGGDLKRREQAVFERELEAARKRSRRDIRLAYAEKERERLLKSPLPSVKEEPCSAPDMKPRGSKTGLVVGPSVLADDDSNWEIPPPSGVNRKESFVPALKKRSESVGVGKSAETALVLSSDDNEDDEGHSDAGHMGVYDDIRGPKGAACMPMDVVSSYPNSGLNTPGDGYGFNPTISDGQEKGHAVASLSVSTRHAKKPASGISRDDASSKGVDDEEIEPSDLEEEGDEDDEFEPLEEREDDDVVLPSILDATQSESDRSFQLNEEQQMVLNLFSEGQNVFAGGMSGTGKSALIEELYLSATITHRMEGGVVAPTWVAALNLGSRVNAVTIHTFTRIGMPASADQLLGQLRMQTERWNKLQFLIIDEIGMVNPDFLDWLDISFRIVRKRLSAAFGGIQLVFLGGFAQISSIPGGIRLNVL